MYIKESQHGGATKHDQTLAVSEPEFSRVVQSTLLLRKDFRAFWGLCSLSQLWALVPRLEPVPKRRPQAISPSESPRGFCLFFVGVVVFFVGFVLGLGVVVGLFV